MLFKIKKIKTINYGDKQIQSLPKYLFASLTLFSLNINDTVAGVVCEYCEHDLLYCTDPSNYQECQSCLYTGLEQCNEVHELLQKDDEALKNQQGKQTPTKKRLLEKAKKLLNDGKTEIFCRHACNNTRFPFCKIRSFRKLCLDNCPPHLVKNCSAYSAQDIMALLTK